MNLCVHVCLWIRVYVCEWAWALCVCGDFRAYVVTDFLLVLEFWQACYCCAWLRSRERERPCGLYLYLFQAAEIERESTHCSCDCGLHMGICGRHLASDKHILHCLTQLWSVLWNASWNHSYNEAESWFRIHTFAETMPWLLTTGIVVDLSKFWRLCKPRSWDLFYA